MRFKFTIILLVLVGTVVCFAGNNFSGEQRVVYAVWAQPTEGRTATIHYANMVDGDWTQPMQLSINNGLHVTPVIATDKKKYYLDYLG